MLFDDFDDFERWDYFYGDDNDQPTNYPTPKNPPSGRVSGSCLGCMMVIIAICLLNLLAMLFL